jgi:hypothetical protein
MQQLAVLSMQAPITAALDKPYHMGRMTPTTPKILSHFDHLHAAAYCTGAEITTG